MMVFKTSVRKQNVRISIYIYEYVSPARRKAKATKNEAELVTPCAKVRCIIVGNDRLLFREHTAVLAGKHIIKTVIFTCQDISEFNHWDFSDGFPVAFSCLTR